MAVPAVVLEAEEEVEEDHMYLMDMTREAADDLAEIYTRLAVVLSNADATRATLVEADELLQEDIDATDTLVAHALTIVPARDDPYYEATLDAAAKLVASVFSEAPLLPGAVGAASDLIATVYAIPPSGTHLSLARGELSVLIGEHYSAGLRFAYCTPDLGIKEGDGTWLAWYAQRDNTYDQAMKTDTRLMAASWEAMMAVRLIGGERMREARKMRQSLHIAINEVEAALVYIRRTRNSVKVEEQIVRNALDDAMGPDPFL
ncbi:hypothetical protein GUJ93_ZPchr0003g17472 [Zizania palustris]|uniref:Uncharacterized protein n=1 Tax=Zizania palustris TaxID=103762 RepID=A0A8J5V739_ZIZPA|nr:hypothetical protein GUJ93_ZPchr0003g17472 [Zizania palustris]